MTADFASGAPEIGQSNAENLIDSDPFASPKALWLHANRHISILGETLNSYFKRPGIYESVIDRNAETGEELLKVRVDSHGLITAACIAFDAINALRSALDHAVFSAVSVVLGIAEPNSTKFPFGDTYTAAQNEFEGRAKGVPASLRDFLLDFKPYKGGDETLWGFNDIRNSKIHCALAPLGALGTGWRLGGNGKIPLFQMMNEWDPSKRELTFAKTRGLSPTLKIGVTIDLAFGPTTALPHRPVHGTMCEVAGTVKRIIMGLEAKSRELET
jgi:hypothetical protein